MCSKIDVSEYWCPTKGCPDYGKKGKGNIVLKERYGKKEQWLLKCKTCGHCFSENRGTIFFNLVTPREEVLRTLAMIPEKGSIRGTARATGHDKSAICRWLKIAGEHCKEVTDYFLRDLQLTKVQIDEIWSYLKKRKRT
jgi:transposase-like protein